MAERGFARHVPAGSAVGATGPQRDVASLV